MTSTTNETILAVIAALDVFSRAPEKTAIESANEWLQQFQHSTEAWVICNALLQSPDMPDAARTFAAQTFRAKVTYDLNQMNESDLLPLRDTLLAAIQRFAAGPRKVLVQLCLAISGLALQLPAWTPTAVQSMIEALGQDPATVPALLEFLTVLPEEIIRNNRIPLSRAEFQERSAILLTNNANQVLELLAMYIQAAGVTSAVQAQVFESLRSWLIAGEVSTSALAQTPLLAYAFEALASEQLFDSAVDVVVDLIHETQEVEDNAEVIQMIMPRIIALRPLLASASEDSEIVRGYCRIFVEAGETYRKLIVDHPDTFLPLVEAIAECSAYSDLEIVRITCRFWYELTDLLMNQPSIPPSLAAVYKALVGIVIGHLHFPADDSSQNAEERDEFRSFRHYIGDTLKDCCVVLGTDTCLAMSYDKVTVGLSNSAQASWQEVEAPLFAMRSMGAEVIPTDDTGVIPRIMDLIPNLPDHPRVRYSALLVVARYTPWVDKHPQYIPFLLQYISAGFSDADNEVVGAAGSAMKYLCKDCKRHLVPYLPQLHTFLTTSGTKLIQEDKLQVYEAVAHVISSMPMEEAAQNLRLFSFDILAKVHVVASSATAATSDELNAIQAALEQLETMLNVVHSFGDELPEACQGAPEETWVIFDALLAKYCHLHAITEYSSRVIRRGLQFFGTASVPLLPSLLSRMTGSFEASGHAGYVWIAAKAVGFFGNEEDPVIREAFKDSYERITAGVAKILSEEDVTKHPDVVEDYLHLLQPMIEFTPDLLLLSPAFPTAFTVVLTALQLSHNETVFAALDFVRIVLSHDALAPPATATINDPIPRPTPPKFPLYAAAIKEVVEKQGFQLVGYLLTGLVAHFPSETDSTVVTIFRIMAALWSQQLLAWLPPVVEQLPTTAVPVPVKQQFLRDVTAAITNGQLDKAKHAFVTLDRESRKARERERWRKGSLNRS